MVIGDPFSKPDSGSRTLNSTSGRGHQFFSSASPLERVSSFSIDLLFLFPLLNFIFSPFYKGAQSALLLDQKIPTSVFLGAGLLVVLGSYILTTALCIHFWGGTPGQRILGLKVVSSVDGSPPGFSSLLTRQFFFLISLGLMGFPLLAVLYDERGRTLVERVSETLVETSKKRRRPLISVEHRDIYLWSARLIGAGVFLILFLHALSIFQNLISEGTSFKFSGCAELDGEVPSRRLELALTLYAADSLDGPCLEREANLALVSGGDLSEIYLAKAFSQSKNADFSDRYLDEVCLAQTPLSERGDRACQFSRLVENWGNWVDDSKVGGRAWQLLEIRAPYATVWGIRQFSSRGWWGDTLTLIEAIPGHSRLADFRQSYKLKALLELGEHRKVRDLFDDASGLWSRALKEDISKKLCSLDLHERGCGLMSHSSCDSLVETSLKHSQDLTPEVAGLVLSVLACGHSRELVLTTSLDKKIPENLKGLWSFIGDLHRGDYQKAELGFKAIAEASLGVEGGTSEPSRVATQILNLLGPGESLTREPLMRLPSSERAPSSKEEP